MLNVQATVSGTVNSPCTIWSGGFLYYANITSAKKVLFLVPHYVGDNYGFMRSNNSPKPPLWEATGRELCWMSALLCIETTGVSSPAWDPQAGGGNHLSNERYCTDPSRREDLEETCSLLGGSTPGATCTGRDQVNACLFLQLPPTPPQLLGPPLLSISCGDSKSWFSHFPLARKDMNSVNLGKSDHQDT